MAGPLQLGLSKAVNFPRSPLRIDYDGPEPFAFLSGTGFQFGEFDPLTIARSSVAAPAVDWLAWALSEPRPVAFGADGEEDERGPLARLLKRPAPYWGFSRLARFVGATLLASGNAYLEIERDRRMGGMPSALHPVDPLGTTKDRYRRLYPGGRAEQVPIDPAAPPQLIGLHYGTSLLDVARGISPLLGVFSEIETDAEASRFAAAILHNLGIPGAVVMPPEPPPVTQIGAKTAAAIGEKWRQVTGGSKRGGTLVFENRYDIQPLKAEMGGLEPAKWRDIAEERVCAALHVPAAVIGYGSGLQQTKVGATMAELHRIAWGSGALPLMTLFLEALNHWLAPEFYPEGAGGIRWDTSGIPALQPDLTAKLAQGEAMLRMGYSVNEVNERLQLGMPERTDPGGTEHGPPLGRVLDGAEF